MSLEPIPPKSLGPDGNIWGRDQQDARLRLERRVSELENGLAQLSAQFASSGRSLGDQVAARVALDESSDYRDTFSVPAAIYTETAQVVLAAPEWATKAFIAAKIAGNAQVDAASDYVISVLLCTGETTGSPPLGSFTQRGYPYTSRLVYFDNVRIAEADVVDGVITVTNYLYVFGGATTPGSNGNYLTATAVFIR